MSDDIKKLTEGDIHRLKAELDDLESYRRWRTELEQYDVVGIVLRRKNSTGPDDVTLHRDQAAGTGTVNSFGFSQAFGKHMTEAMDGWLNYQVNNRRETLHRSGVETE